LAFAQNAQDVGALDGLKGIGLGRTVRYAAAERADVPVKSAITARRVSILPV
jgi:hypothetical protein